MHHDAFLGSIRDTPDDDTPRLVYGDWLDEHGDVARAEFIRVQCALAGLAETDAARWALLARERQLLWQHGKGWAGRLRHLVKRYAFRRGFVEDITLSADGFLRDGAGLFRLAPVRRARLSDAGVRIAELAASPLLGRLVGLDLRHTTGLDTERARPLLHSPHLTGLRELGLRGTRLCSGPGVRALAACPGVVGLTSLDVGDHRRSPSARRDTYAWRWDTRESQDGAAMRSLVESPHLTGLRSLRLEGYGLCFHREALDRLIGSRLLSGLRELDLSLTFPDTFPDCSGPPDLLNLLGRYPRLPDCAPCDCAK